MIFQEVHWIRSNLNKLCPTLKEQALEWYRPFRRMPCYINKILTKMRQHYRRIPIIVQFKPGREMKQCIESARSISGLKVKNELPIIHSITTKVNAKTLEKLVMEENVQKIWIDRTMKAILDVATPSTGTPYAWDLKTEGKGVGIAIIDTGIHPHADLNGRIIAFHDLVNGKNQAYDDNGHGTHVAGDAASDGSQSSIYKGPAPSANLIGVKVLDRFGSGMLSTVIRGIQWCIENKEKYNIRVMNLSLGAASTEPSRDDPVCQAVEEAWTQGIAVCVAAGNDGPQQRTIATPGCDPMVITVGAVNDNNSLSKENYSIAVYSSRGPTIDDINKPDLVCNGTNIISLRSPNSIIDKQNKSARIESDYISLSGTSMATPICSGIVALLLEAKPELAPDEIKDILMKTAIPFDNVPEYAQGSGLINAESGIRFVLQ